MVNSFLSIIEGVLDAVVSHADVAGVVALAVVIAVARKLIEQEKREEKAFLDAFKGDK